MGQSGGRRCSGCRSGQLDIISGIGFCIHHVQVFNFVMDKIMRVKALKQEEEKFRCGVRRGEEIIFIQFISNPSSGVSN